MRPIALTALFLACAAYGPLAAAEDCRKPRKELIERFDADKDGTLSESEKATAKAALAERRAKHQQDLLAKHPELDSDKDGSLSKDEMKAAREAREGKRQQHLKEKHPKAHATFDTNSDGTLDDAERAAARAQFKAKHPKGDGEGHRKHDCMKKPEGKAAVN